VLSSLCYNRAMRISEAGEFGLIASITGLIRRTSNKKAESWKDLVISAGDDTAAWKQKKGLELATTDILVEGVHFDFSSMSWTGLGWKSIAVNVSDIAAMGGFPRYALVSLALPAHHSVENVLDMYRGMIKACNLYGVAIAGGNISSAEKVAVNITLTGSCAQSPMMRSSARSGELIAVTGYPGLSAAGLYTIRHKTSLPATARKLFLGAHTHPLPLVEEGLELASLGVETAIDTSDGLIADLTHICEASRKSAVIYTGSMPVHPLLKRYFPGDYMTLALTGGEDYALLFTAEKELMEDVKLQLAKPVTVIGEITSAKTGKITVLDAQGKPFFTGPGGWDHYRKQRHYTHE
jgi:thiamine-monophosphate kinase